MKRFVLTLAALLLCPLVALSAADSRPNVLFIAVDDLRPELGCYGQSPVQSPNMDRLASRAVVFTRAYCQIASCCPSRSSFLTGLRSDRTGVFDNQTHFRQHVPDVVTLPQHFKAHGYHTQALGKVFHGGFEKAHGGREMDDARSWSVPTWVGSPRNYFSPEGIQKARAVFARKTGKRGAELDAWTEESIRCFPTEAPDVPDNVLYDGMMADRAVEVLREIKDRPFFLAVGLLKPHLPLVAPKKYWDLYDEAQIQLAPNDDYPRAAPAVAVHDSEELRRYLGMPKTGPLSDDQARHVRHAYYACVSFMDAQVGRILAELDRLGLREKTIVVVCSDHGWHLGEQNMWCKNTNFERATRVPLVVALPDAIAAVRTSNALVELVDLYPSLCELARLPLPQHLEGTSFAPLLADPARPWKQAAFSQHTRQHNGQGLMGYTMRTDSHRLTIWQSDVNPTSIEAVELYDHRADPDESENIAALTEHAPLVKKLTEQWRRGWQAAKP